MKIKKNALTNKATQLVEEEQEIETKSPVIDTTGTTSDIADDIKDAVQAVTDGEETISDSNSKKLAVEVKQTADEIDAGAGAMTDDDLPIGVENRITKLLDDALETAIRNKRRHSREGANVLLIGLPGSGKTATVYDWAKSRSNINLAYINAKNNDLDAYINGYTVRKENEMKVGQAYSDNLSELEQPNSIMFLDEYNRQTNPKIRASLLTLINEHKISGDGPNKTHEFKNLLFTIACINPAVPTDKGAAPLNDAEISRFTNILADADSDPDTTINYLTKYYDFWIGRLKKDDQYYLEDLEDYLRIQDLGIFIASHVDFKYDDKDDLEDLAAFQRKMLNQRALTSGLSQSRGRVKKFKDWVETFSGFLDKDVNMLVNILSEYIEPTFEELCSHKGINLDGTPAEQKVDSKNSNSASDETTAENEVAPEEDELEDDDDLFISNKNAYPSARAKNPFEVEDAIRKALASW